MLHGDFMQFDRAKRQGKAAAVCRRQIVATWRVERPVLEDPSAGSLLLLQGI
jgi:hypothetical protein